ncbi:MAG: acyltransferase [Actinomycetota bacterium]|nr:acyltransferase [Actinomycetota bacterium]
MTTTAEPRVTAADLARLTPDTRDRYVDFLRVASIGVVVLGHWLMAVVTLNNGELSTENVLGMVPGLWLLTWLLQVMPIFFFVGGFSNFTTIDAYRRKGRGYGEFVAGRVQRLIRPVIVLMAIWVPLAFALERGGIDHAVLVKATRLVCQPLWFVAVYLVVSTLAPVMRDLHARYRVFVPAALVGAAVVADFMRFAANSGTVGYANMLFIWLFAQQLGFFYADGSLARIAPRQLVAIFAGAVATLAALTTFGPYPGSMVGVGKVSNMSPPTVCLAVLAVLQVALAMLVRPAAQRWLQRKRVWTAVVAGNGVIMTVFLWHLSAMLLAVAVLLPLGFPQPAGGTALWWATRPLWVLAASIPLLVVVSLLGRTERPRPATPVANGPYAAVVAAIGATLLAAGIIGLALSNLAELEPLRTFVPAALGLVLLRVAVTHTAPALTKGTAQ